MSGRVKVTGASNAQPLEPAVLGAAPLIPDPSSPDFRRVVDTLPAAIYVTDAEGNITYYNDAAATLWGYRPLLGDSKWCGSWRLYWPDGRPMAHDQCPMALAIKEGRPITGAEAIAERPDGSRVRFMPFPKLLHDDAGTLTGAVNMLVDITDRRQAEEQQRLKSLSRVARSIASDLDLEHTVQSVIEIATEAAGARFGAFLYNVADEQSESYVLYASAGAPREAIAKLELLHNTILFDATFRGGSPMRLDDIRQEARHGETVPHLAVNGDLPLASYLAVPVISRTGKLCGGLFFGHDQPAIFTQDVEDIIVGIAAHAAIAIDNASLLRSARLENIQRGRAEDDIRKLAAIIENSEDAIVSKNLDGIITSWNKGAERLFGYTPEEAIGRSVTMLMPPDRVDEEPGIIARIRRGERVEHYDTVRRRKDGNLVDISLTVSPVKDAEGRIVGASKIARDISERKRAEQQQQLLVGEIKHRIKNTLATVQAIARQTLQGTPMEEREAFIARLMALATAHDLLTIERWNRAALRDVVDQALKPFQEKHSMRILVHGPDDAWLDGQRSSLLTMALHELATNAVKYGSLSNSYGIVRVTWEIETEGEMQRARLTWRELGGPLVIPPERKGFGSFLIERALQGGSGKSKLEFNPNGLVCTLKVGL